MATLQTRLLLRTLAIPDNETHHYGPPRISYPTHPIPSPLPPRLSLPPPPKKKIGQYRLREITLDEYTTDMEEMTETVESLPSPPMALSAPSNALSAPSNAGVLAILAMVAVAASLFWLRSFFRVKKGDSGDDGRVGDGRESSSSETSVRRWVPPPEMVFVFPSIKALLLYKRFADDFCSLPGIWVSLAELYLEDGKDVMFGWCLLLGAVAVATLIAIGLPRLGGEGLLYRKVFIDTCQCAVDVLILYRKIRKV